MSVGRIVVAGVMFKMHGFYLSCNLDLAAEVSDAAQVTH